MTTCKGCSTKQKTLKEDKDYGFTCAHCFKRYRTEKTPTPKLCNECATTHKRCKICLTQLEIAAGQMTLG